jgi:hypothetical protein
MTTEFILTMLYFILTIPLVLVIVSIGAGEKIDQPKIAEHKPEKSDVESIPSSVV